MFTCCMACTTDGLPASVLASSWNKTYQHAWLYDTKIINWVGIYIYYRLPSLYYKVLYKISGPQLVNFCPSGAAHDQQVFLSSNNPTPCFGDTVDLICYYPDVMERVNRKPKYTATMWPKRPDLCPFHMDT